MRIRFNYFGLHVSFFVAPDLIRSVTVPLGGLENEDLIRGQALLMNGHESRQIESRPFSFSIVFPKSSYYLNDKIASWNCSLFSHDGWSGANSNSMSKILRL